MGGFIYLHVDVIRGGMETYGVAENAIFIPGNVKPRYERYLAFSGTSVTLDGEQRYLDSQLSYQRACLHAIDYLTTFGYTPEQAYMILGAAPIEGRFSGVVDIPNSCATVYLPTGIFDFPVEPSQSGPAASTPARGCRAPAAEPEPAARSPQRLFGRQCRGGAGTGPFGADVRVPRIRRDRSGAPLRDHSRSFDGWALR